MEKAAFMMRPYFEQLILRPLRLICLSCIFFGDVYGKNEAQGSWIDEELREHFNLLTRAPRVIGRFEESRSYSFRKEPKVLHGTYRRNEDGGLSFAYEGKTPVVVHVTSNGRIYLREGKGRIIDMTRRAAVASDVQLLSALFTLEFASVVSDFQIETIGGSADWKVTLIRKQEADLSRKSYHTAELTGNREQVESITLTKKGGKRIRILIGEPIFPEFFLPADKDEYFFELPE